MSSRPAKSGVAVGYVRVSTEDQAQGPKAQRDSLEAYAKARRLKLVVVHEDLGVSGAAPIDERPGLLAALDAIHVYRAEALLVAKRDRLARDVVIAAMVERLVVREDARIESADGAANGDGPEAEMMRGILGVFAQFERALIRARTKAALGAKKRRRERTGSVPYGSTLGPDKKTLLVNHNERECIRLAAKLRRECNSFAAIGRMLSQAGYGPRSGRKWHPMTVARLVRHAEALEHDTRTAEQHVFA